MLPNYKQYDSQNQAGWPGFLINENFLVQRASTETYTAC